MVNLLQSFLEDFPLSTNELTLPACPARYLKVDFLKTKPSDDDSLPSKSFHHAQSSLPLPFASSPVYQTKIVDAKYLVKAKEINDETVKDVIELTLDTQQEISKNFTPGDTIGILPENNDNDINTILRAMNLTDDEADHQIQISLKQNNENTKKSYKIPSHIPSSSVITTRIILKQCLHINSVPKKLFLRSLIECTSDAQEKQFLRLICSKEGAAFYTKMTTENGLTFKKLLKMCPSCKPDLSLLLEHLPRLLPRPYSIATSPLEDNQNQIKIIASILTDNPGVTTTYLRKFVDEFIRQESKVTSPQHINCFLRLPTQFMYTESEIRRNVILISVGCGISPFLSFIKHKEKYFEQTNNSYNFSQIWLLTGYKYRKCSLYSDKIRKYLETNIVNRLYESYSREPDSEFKYVQEIIWENRNDISRMIFENNCILYVCADGKNISKSIQETILKLIKTTLECDDDKAKAEFLKLQLFGKYKEDIWM